MGDFVGTSGADVISGSADADTMHGLGGNDIYIVNHPGDLVFEAAGEGVNDAIYSSLSYALSFGQEVETLSTLDWNSTAAINLTGNEIANYMTGNAGANVLNGGGGADVMQGLGGDDIYIIDHVGDQIYESIAGTGNDAAYSSVSYTLAAGEQIETLATLDWGSTAAINLTGNEIANYLIGNAGANVLNGAGGADVLQGLGGDDTYIIDHAGDQIYESIAGTGNDAAYSSVSYTLAAGEQIETLATLDWGSAAAINLTGNEIANYIIGNAGANVLNGGAGFDALQGLGGNDIFEFTTALGAGNIDIIVDFVAGSDKIRLGGGAGQPFAQLASGALAASSFVIGAGALDANDYLIYNSGTGALLFDADGNGAGAAVQFATLSTGLALTAADFIVSGPANTAPAITSGATASIAENSPASTIVYQTQATDADGDRITYSLTGADAALLTIDASGAVRLITSPDFETRSTYVFNVVASDSGTSTSKAVTLSVTDVPDSAGTPIINETASSNDAFATAQVIDRNTFVVAANPNLPDDDLPSATIVGSISGIADEDFFSITLQAGEKLILDVDFTNGGLDSHIFVYGPNQIEIANNDDQGPFDPGSTGIATTHNTDSLFQFRAQTAGTYYFKIRSFEQTSAGAYQINVSIGPPASAAVIFQEDVDALISGAAWNHTNLTYGFPQLASQYPDSFDEANPDNEFQPFSTIQQAATRQLIQLVANVSSLTFTELVGNPGQADLRYAMSTDDDVEAAHAYYPTNQGPNSLGGTSWYNTTNFDTPLKGGYAWMGILHETGHALGLEHAHEDAPTVSPEHDSLEYTVMTYRSYIGDPLTGGYSNEQFGFPQTLMMLDIAALQKIYGANFAFNSSDSVYTWNPTTGEMSINGAGQGAPGNGAGGMQNRVFLTIWDGGGTDSYDMSNYTNGVSIDLRPGEWSITSAVQLADLNGGPGGGSPIYARGNVANALLYNGNQSSLIEHAVGGSGNDSLTANEAPNRLTGNGGVDTFRWVSRADGGDLGGAADVIADFLRGTDKIDLSGIDANPATGADDAFTFIGAGAFTSVAGQLRYQIEGSDLRIQGDTDGNGVSDFEIIVHNNTIFAASDFVL